MLKGGTAGQQTNDNENGAGTFGSFTRQDVKTVYASPKKTIDVRVLPAFDQSMSLEDTAFNTGYESYRALGDEVDEDTNTEAFSAWFWCIEGYTYFGLGKKQFISPLTGTTYFPAGHDPIRDTWKYIDKYVNDARIKTLAHGKTVLDSTTKKEIKKQGYLSKTPRRFALMNILVDLENKGVWENAVLVVSQTTLKDLKDQLSIQTKRSDNVVITKAWEDYYYGDITDPAAGAVVRVQEKYISIGNNTVRTCGFFMDQDPGNEANHNILQRPVTEEELAGRYRVFDTENVTNLPAKEEQYQIMLDYLVEDGVVPLDILEAACGKYGKVNGELRASNASWFEGEEPIIGASEVNKVSTPTSTAPKPTEKQMTGTAQAVSSIKSTPKKEEDPILDEDVDTEPDTPAAEPEGSADDDVKRARFKALEEKMGKETLTSEELTEIASLAAYAS